MAENFQALLAAAHTGQPVVNQGDPQIGPRPCRPMRGADPDAGFHAGPLRFSLGSIPSDTTINGRNLHQFAQPDKGKGHLGGFLDSPALTNS
jgi:hypothetical protein